MSKLLRYVPTFLLLLTLFSSCSTPLTTSDRSVNGVASDRTTKVAIDLVAFDGVSYDLKARFMPIEGICIFNEALINPDSSVWVVEVLLRNGQIVREAQGGYVPPQDLSPVNIGQNGRFADVSILGRFSPKDRKKLEQSVYKVRVQTPGFKCGIYKRTILTSGWQLLKED